MFRRRLRPAVLFLAAGLLMVGCDGEGGRQAERTETVLAVGDGATCKRDEDEKTADLVARLEGTVLLLADIAYEAGTTQEFQQCYLPGWGRHRERIRPVPGNHEYRSDPLAGYFAFYGAQAGPRGQGWYSYDLGEWHLIALNSNCDEVGCDRGSEQERWLREDLARHPGRCTLAYWHHARFSSGSTHGGDDDVDDLWKALHEGGADVVLAAHEHNYERFAPLGPEGEPDPARGIRQFVVGTGGRSHYPFGPPVPGSETRNSDTFGVLELSLSPGRYRWRFLPSEGKFRDSGSGTCR